MLVNERINAAIEKYSVIFETVKPDIRMKRIITALTPNIENKRKKLLLL